MAGFSVVRLIFQDFFIQTCAERMSLPELADDADGMISWAREMWMWISFGSALSSGRVVDLWSWTLQSMFLETNVFLVYHIV